MTDVISKMLHLGLGLAAVTKEKAEAVVSELIKQGHLSQEEAGELVDDLVKKGETSQEEITHTLKDLVHKTVARMDLPTREDFERLEKRLEEIESKLAPPSA